MKNFIKNNKDYVIIAVVSLIAFIIGCLALNVFLAFIIIGLADLVLFIPNLNKARKKAIKGRHASLEKNKAKKTIKNKETKKTEKKPKDKKKKKKKKLWTILLIIFLSFVVLVVAAICLFIGYIVKNAPKFDPKELYHQEPSILYDIDGKEFGYLGEENREMVSYEDLPEVLIDAIVATEDSRFFQHNGVDLPRFTKATAQTLLGSSNAGGASTLTMQLVKNHFTSTKQTLTRKFTDMYMAVYQIEKKYTKEEILEFYVNAPYLGSGSYGVEQACQTYFGKSVRDINLAEAALIAGLFQSPGADDPFRHPEKAEARRQIVLKLMERHGYITKEQRKIASSIKVEKLLVSKEEKTTNEYQGFIDTVIEELQKDGIDPYKNSLKIYTTMHREKQDHINAIMKGETWDWKDEKATAGIAVVDVNNGDLVAVGAGRNKTSERTFNTATQLNNQIGSTAKPLYEYSVGIEYENWSTYEPFTDENITYSDGTKLNNWDGSYKGFLTLRSAMAESRNTSAVKAFKKNNTDNIRKVVTSLGLHPEEYLHQAHAIGGYTGECPVTMAAAYATFANNGVYNSPRSYTKVIYKETGKEVKKEEKSEKVFSPQTAYMMTSLLQSSAKNGLGAYSNINGTVYGAKTGTSNFDDNTKRAKGLPANAINDYWVSGTSPDYAISVWYGYDKKDINSEYYNRFGNTYHEKLFQKVGQGVFKKGSSFKNPGGVSSVAVEVETYPAKLPSKNTPSGLIVTELFKSGTEPTEESDRFSTLSDVKDLNSSINGNQVTLTWTGIETPNANKEGYLRELSEKLYETKGWQNKFVSSRLSYVSNNLGSIVYRIYAKDEAGNLTQIETTSNNSITFNVNSGSSTKYVVKASYSIYTGNMSNGVETTVSLDGVTDYVDLQLIGESSMVVEKGKYEERGVRVAVNGVELTSVEKTIIYKNNATNTPTTIELMRSTPGVYTVEYIYKEKSIKRTVTVK